MGDAAAETGCLTGVERDLELVAGIDAVPKILDIVCHLTGMGFAAVARVTDSQWIACAVRDDIGFGLGPGDELPLKTTLCNEIRLGREAVVIDNVAEDLRYHNHPTPALYGLQSYISYPIIRENGEFFGTLCAIDRKPAQVSRIEVMETFRLFSELIAFHIEAVDKVAASEAALIDANEAAVLREQFVAVLGHDLRNPLAAIQAGASFLQRSQVEQRTQFVVQQIIESAGRMERLIGDVLDFARGRLGGGIPLSRLKHVDLSDLVEQTVQELRAAWPDRAIITELDIARPVGCDPDRMAQLISNLLANALAHGSASAPVVVRARTGERTFELSVANAGPPIPDKALPQLFQPFKRKESGDPRSGLGLGLYIASQIADGHGGALDVHSTPEETCFRLVMPLV